MSSKPQPQEFVNPKTGMTHSEMKQFVRNHFEEFVNRKNLNIGNVNFAPEFVDYGADVPPGLPPGTRGSDAICGRCLQEIP
jgi:hypothetical protein